MTNLGQDEDRKGLTKGRTDMKYNFTNYSISILQISRTGMFFWLRQVRKLNLYCHFFSFMGDTPAPGPFYFRFILKFID